MVLLIFGVVALEGEEFSSVLELEGLCGLAAWADEAMFFIIGFDGGQGVFDIFVVGAVLLDEFFELAVALREIGDGGWEQVLLCHHFECVIAGAEIPEDVEEREHVGAGQVAWCLQGFA